jgi:hypothetical protein
MHSCSPCSCHMSCPSHPSWLHHSHYTWRRVRVTRRLIMQSLYPPVAQSLFSFSSALSSQTSSVYAAPLMPGTKFCTHTELHEKL